MRRGAHAGCLVDVLVGQWNAEQRRSLPGHHGPFGSARGGQRLALGHQQESAQLRVLGLDPRQQFLHELHRRQPLRGDQAAGLSNGKKGACGACHRPRRAGLRATGRAARRFGAGLAAALALGLAGNLALGFAAVRAGCTDTAVPEGGGSRNVQAMSSASGRSCGMAAISPATCRQASTRSATWPGFSTSPVRESRSCISPGLIAGTDMAGAAGMRIGTPFVTAGNPSQPCPGQQAAAPKFLHRSGRFAAPRSRRTRADAQAAAPRRADRQQGRVRPA